MRTHAIRNKRFLFVSFALSVLTACSSNTSLTVNNDEIKNEVVINLGEKKQVIRNFGASDAWVCQYVGLWPDEKRNQVADWLFSLETDSKGNPKGIGLSLWRFNIGAGSANQSDITDEWRRAEGFLQDDGSYDWTKQAGQRWFMQAAKQRGVNLFTAFTNSPPVQLTKNGKAFSSNGEDANIAPENYPAFAKFLSDVLKHFDNEGIPFTYVAPFNEPQWDWTGNGQEGCPYTNEQVFLITQKLDSVLTAEGTDVKIQLAEAGKLNYLYEKADKPSRGQQISEFFNASSSRYVGNFLNVDKVISGHSYFTTTPPDVMKNTRKTLADQVKTASVPIEFWQSEYCVLGDQEEIVPVGKDTGIDPALYIARVIHHDLAMANASAWHWWLALSVYDYKDGLIYMDKNKSNGIIEDSKTLWALGNYSRFIRPGSMRVSVHSDNRDVDNLKSLMISAYVDAESKKTIVVMINYSAAESVVKLKTLGGTVKSWQPYITGPNEDENLKSLTPLQPDQNISIPKRSVVTFVGELQ